MKYYLYSVGKIREPFYLTGINEYLKRLNPYMAVELVDGFEEKLSPNANKKEITNALAKEGQKLLKNITADDIIILLDIGGTSLSSIKFARELEKYNLSGKKRLIFIIGSSYGVANEVKLRANATYSFSAMTFPHQMAVMILVEQIYRSFKILRNEPYHK